MAVSEFEAVDKLGMFQFIPPGWSRGMIISCSPKLNLGITLGTVWTNEIGQDKSDTLYVLME